MPSDLAKIKSNLDEYKKSLAPVSERDALIADLRAKIKRAEERGHFDTAHHDMLKQILSEEK